MKYLTVLLLLYCQCVLSKEELVDWQQCKLDDTACHKKLAAHLVTKVVNGATEHGIDSLDPLTCPILRIKSHEKVNILMTNLNITGLGNVVVENYRLSNTEKYDEFTLSLNININSNIQIRFTDPIRVYPGTQMIKARVHVTTKYNYEEKVNEDGIAFYEIGPEVTNCDNANINSLTMNTELKEFLESDSELKNNNELNILNPDFWRNSTCKVAEFVVAKIVHNLRLLARLEPITTFIES